MRATLLALLLAGPAAAQSLNVDLGIAAYAPSSAYRAAANQDGFWNEVTGLGTWALQDTAGAATGVTLTVPNGSAFFLDANLGGSRARLMQDGLTFVSPTTWNFEGLAPGTYEVTTYAWMPALGPSPERMQTTVPASLDPAQETGAPWPCLTAGASHAVHRVHTSSGTITVGVQALVAQGIVNGFQVRELSPAAPGCELTALPGTQASTRYGPVALEGTTAVTIPDHNGPSASPVYLLEGGAGQWTITQDLSAIAAPPMSVTNTTVVIDGDRLLYGSRHHATGGFINVGGVYVFERGPAGWAQSEFIVPSPIANYQFGSAVDLEGSRALIGAYARRVAFIYERTQQGWVEAARLEASEPQNSSSFFGISVALEGDWAFVGSPRRETAGVFQAGVVYVFHRTAAGWVEEARLTAEVPIVSGRFGVALAAEDGHALIGSSNVNGRGQVDVFAPGGGSWQRVATVRPDDSQVDDRFGESLSISGSRAVIGAPQWSLDCDEIGAAYLFQLEFGEWRQFERMHGPAVENGLRFGFSVALDGDELLVGTHQFGHAVFGASCAPELGSSYCGPAAASSSGLPAVVSARGSATAGTNALTLSAVQLPSHEFGYFLASLTDGFITHPGGSAGNLCLGGAIARFASQVQSSGSAGILLIAVDTTAIPTTPPSTVQAGETWHFQAWFRDGTGSNFSNGVRVTFD